MIHKMTNIVNFAYLRIKEKLGSKKAPMHSPSRSSGCGCHAKKDNFPPYERTVQGAASPYEYNIMNVNRDGYGTTAWAPTMTIITQDFGMNNDRSDYLITYLP